MGENKLLTSARTVGILLGGLAALCRTIWQAAQITHPSTGGWG